MVTNIVVKKGILCFLILAFLLAGCTGPLSITATPPHTPDTAAQSAIPTNTREVLSSPAATAPPPTETPLVGIIPTITPGPTPSPVPITVTPDPAKCVRTESAEQMPVYLGDCVFWVDEHSNESGFRIELIYDNSGEIFLFDVPANTTSFDLPADASPRRLDESREHCIRRNSFSLMPSLPRSPQQL